MKIDDEIDRRQLQAYRQMKGEERLRIGLGLFEASLDVARQAIQNQFPEATEADVEERLRQRIRAGYEIHSKSTNPS